MCPAWALGCERRNAEEAGGEGSTLYAFLARDLQAQGGSGGRVLERIKLLYLLSEVPRGGHRTQDWKSRAEPERIGLVNDGELGSRAALQQRSRVRLRQQSSWETYTGG